MRQTNFCPYCEAPVASSNRFCIRCGQPTQSGLQKGNNQTPARQQKWEQLQPDNQKSGWSSPPHNQTAAKANQNQQLSVYTGRNRFQQKNSFHNGTIIPIRTQIDKLLEDLLK